MMRVLVVIFGLVCFGLIGSLAAENFDRVVVLGFDGIEPSLLEKWMAQGYLPHMAQLARKGSYHHLQTTNPAQSPVAWSSFAVGANPGKTRIMGFLSRRWHSYEPSLATARLEYRPLMGQGMRILLALGLGAVVSGLLGLGLWGLGQRRPLYWYLCALFGVLLSVVSGYALIMFLPQRIPVAVANKQGVSFWTLTGRAGIETVVLRAPIAFPASSEASSHTRLLCGLGVPDIRGTNGLWSYYTNEAFFEAETTMGGWIMPLVRKGAQCWESYIHGPRNILISEALERVQRKLRQAHGREVYVYQNQLGRLRAKAFVKVRLKVRVAPAADQLTLEFNQRRVVVAQGHWSPWLAVDYTLSPLMHLRGMFRVRVLQVKPHIRFYLTPVQWHPLAVPSNVALSWPPRFCVRLVALTGELYGTLGWESSTNPTNDGKLPEKVFLEELQDIFRVRRKMFWRYFTRQNWRLLVNIFYFTDRVSHMCWRDIDNPHHNPVLDCYRQMDQLVGQVVARLGPHSLLLVLSDHGFAPFRWGFNLNTWLLHHGYLSLKHKVAAKKISDLFKQSQLPFDWAHTQAYAIGLGKIYLNLKGRDPQGIVSPAQYEALRTRLVSALEKYRHQGRRVIHKVYRREEIYHGQHLTEAADLILGFCKGYRISWQTTLGGVPAQEIELNQQQWSGDHCSVDPHLIPGILLSNRRLNTENPSILDLAPTILQALGVKIPAVMEGRALLANQ